MISRSVENSSRLSIRLPVTITERAAGEGFPASLPGERASSPEAGGIAFDVSVQWMVGHL
jgi:hypothetical protein